MGGINLLQSNLNTKGPSETQLMGGNSLEGQQVRKEFSTKSLTLTFPTPTGPEYVVFEGTAQELSALEGRAQEIFQPQGVSVDMFSNGTIGRLSGFWRFGSKQDSNVIHTRFCRCGVVGRWSKFLPEQPFLAYELEWVFGQWRH